MDTSKPESVTTGKLLKDIRAARSPEEASATFARLEESCQLSAGTMLISTREYKKTSMTFFAN